ncbi:hypothetical protein AK812_SmicGene12450 [Symbiodinium microadriaticum]|uniref:Uncharacterized protein n=1 Tax=Symbiodinium microadriaticum TaxID=2951 RepID=A0A1Q9EAS0_SYMMI|nr:hypothetical protein AK812_SmicGene12450 [Symbiodinium microadriaticum]
MQVALRRRLRLALTGLLARRAKIVERAWVRVAREAVGAEGASTWWSMAPLPTEVDGDGASLDRVLDPAANEAPSTKLGEKKMPPVRTSWSASSASRAKRRFVGVGQELVDYAGGIGATSRHEHSPRVSLAGAPPCEPTVGT